MPDGYCTLDDVRRVLGERNLPGDIDQDTDLAIDAIYAQSEWVEKTYHRHWYVPGGISEDSEGLIPTDVNTRDDEHDIPTHGGFVHGASERERWRFAENSDALLESGPRYDRRRRARRVPKREIRIATGEADALIPPVDETIPAYTRITLDRKDVAALNELHVINETGGYDDWVASNDYSGGVGTANRGEDYWVRINNRGVSELYLDVHAMDDDLASFANAVYVDLDYGHDGLPRRIRRAVALRSAAHFVQEAAIQIPENARLYNIESQAEAWRSKAAELLTTEETVLDDPPTEEA